MESAHYELVIFYSTDYRPMDTCHLAEQRATMSVLVDLCVFMFYKNRLTEDTFEKANRTIFKQFSAVFKITFLFLKLKLFGCILTSVAC